MERDANPRRDRVSESAVVDELVGLFARGDDSALRRLLDREAPGLRRHLAARMPRDVLRRQGVSDTIQKACLGIVRSRQSLTNGGLGDFRRLLKVIAERVLVNTIDYERAKKRDARRHLSLAHGFTSSLLEPIAIPSAKGPTPSESVMKREAIEALRRAFDRLSPEDQRILHLVDYESRTYVEAAAELGTTYEAAKKRYLRALGKLRELMTE